LTYCDLGRTKAESSRKNEPNFRPAAKGVRRGAREQVPEERWEQTMFPGHQQVVGCVTKSHRDAGRCVIASSTHPTGFCPRSGRFVCGNSAFSQQISTFYGPSVQSIDTQLNALATLSVLARTVSGCWNSAFLGLERNRSAVGKTKAPLVAGGPQQLTPPTPYSPLPFVPDN
jgi:hypothetical protein